MDISLTSPLLSLYLAEFVFGSLYAVLIWLLSVKHVFPGGTAGSVIVGNAATLFIHWLFIRTNWDPMVTLITFAYSGVPMAITYWCRRYLRVEKARHCQRAWPTNARKARDLSLMELTRLISDIEDAAKTERITAGFLLGVTNDLHCVKKILTSV